MPKRKRQISSAKRTALRQSERQETTKRENNLEKQTTETQQFFLLKSEPESRLEKGVDVRFSIQDLQNEPDQSATWDGVRNYQARNILKSMKKDDLAFFYHSNCKEPGIVGIVRIIKEAFPDPTQFEPKSPYYDPKSSKDNPTWYAVQVKLEEVWERKVTLQELKKYDNLSDMDLFKRARLSVQKILEHQCKFILDLLQKNKQL